MFQSNKVEIIKQIVEYSLLHFFFPDAWDENDSKLCISYSIHKNVSQFLSGFENYFYFALILLLDIRVL